MAPWPGSAPRSLELWGSPGEMGTLFGELVFGLNIKLNCLVSITIDLARL